MAEARVFDAVVVGGGPAGMCCALALARGGAATAVVTPAGEGGGPADIRTAALFAGSIELLRNLGAWEHCAAQSAPIHGVRIVDDLGGILKSPEVCFTAAEIGRGMLGYNVPQTALSEALGAVAAATPGLAMLRGVSVVSAAPAPNSIALDLSDGSTLSARIAVAADGRRSVMRSVAGVDVETWSYPQAALACSFEHERPHGGISTELHRPMGPCTTVPLPGNASSLVWVESPAETERLKSMDGAQFTEALEGVLKGLLGAVCNVGARAAFPLSVLRARSLAQNRIALIGEAGHVIPPIGAQGLNLGLRDAAVLAEMVGDACGAGRDPGSRETLSGYSSARSADVATRILGVDALNRTLLSSLAPVHLVRGLGLHALRGIGPLRKALIREGLEPSGVTSKWLRPAGQMERAGAAGLASPSSDSAGRA